MYLMTWRDYDPNTTRFTISDTYQGEEEKPFSTNKYLYAEGDPVNNVDPAGHWVMDVAWLMVDAVEFAVNPTLGGAAMIATDIVAFADPTGAFSTATHAAEAGRLVSSYSKIKRLVKGTQLEVHHLIEQRLASEMKVKARGIASVALSTAEHRKYTNLWREIIPYTGGKYSDLSRKQVRKAINYVYQDNRHLRAASLKWLRKSGWRPKGGL